MSECVNLKERFGHIYKIEIEEGGTRNDPWSFLIPCRGGHHIYPHGGTTLAMSCSTTLRNRIFEEDGKLYHLKHLFTMLQDGSDGANIGFDIDDFGIAADIVKPKRKRRMTKEQKEAAKVRLKEYQFKPTETLKRVGK